jgi:aminoglycoside/choline kinase family phosphotransferase
MHDAIVALFTETFGQPPAGVTRLTADGSQRTYYRLTGTSPASVIGAHGPDPDENRAFLSFSRSFRSIGLPVPEIFGVAEGRGIWLEEDLGDTTLFQALSSARRPEAGEFPGAMMDVYERVLEMLPRFQVEGGRVIDFSVAYPRPAFDEQSMLWDLNYFKYHFLKLTRIPFNEQRLENDFNRLIGHLLEAETGYFLYRDFQSRNIMLRGGEPWFVDYQGGRRGAAQYDVASLLYDAKADIPERVRAQLLERYLNVLSRHANVDAGRFLETYRGYVLIRIMQAMGAYGYRGFFERKPRFLESVPYAARNVAVLLATGLPIELPELESVFQRVVEAWADRPGPIALLPGLTVHITSFSYQQGLPPDETGHGGGFVFDCRSLPNPGRYPKYAGVNGSDASVVEFLEAAPEVEAFWRHVHPLVDAHIASFRDRGFSDLSVAFGCTGGQHRSVYFAERLARHIREHHPDVAVHLEHSAMAKWPVPEAEASRPEGAASPGEAHRAALSTKDQPWTR